MSIMVRQHIAVLTSFLSLVVSMACASQMYTLPLTSSKGRPFEALAEANSADNLHGEPGQGYYISMSIGTPPQQLNVLVDTGSSNFAVAAAPHPDIDRYFNRTSSSSFRDLQQPLKLPYVQGKWSGMLGKDLAEIAAMPNLTVEANIACILNSDQFFVNGSHWQGILGLAYSKIARPDASIEPFLDSLVAQRSVENIFTMQLCGPHTDQASHLIDMAGTMTIGGISESLYSGDIYYTPINREWYYEIVIAEIYVGDTRLAMDCKEYNFDKTIVDSGTTNLRLPVRVFRQVLRLLKQKSRIHNRELPDGFWAMDEMLCWPQVPWQLFPKLTLQIAASDNSTFGLVLSPQQYMRAVRSEDESATNQQCYKFAISSSTSGTVLGAVLMEGFYVVFDRENQQIGFAQTTCNNNTSPLIRSSIIGPAFTKHVTSDCVYRKPSASQSPLLIVAYTMAALCAFCLLLLGALTVHCQLRAWWRQRRHRSDTLLNTAAADDR